MPTISEWRDDREATLSQVLENGQEDGGELLNVSISIGSRVENRYSQLHSCQARLMPHVLVQGDQYVEVRISAAQEFAIDKTLPPHLSGRSHVITSSNERGEPERDIVIEENPH